MIADLGESHFLGCWLRATPSSPCATLHEYSGQQDKPNPDSRELLNFSTDVPIVGCAQRPKRVQYKHDDSLCYNNSIHDQSNGLPGFEHAARGARVRLRALRWGRGCGDKGTASRAPTSAVCYA